MYAAQSHTCGLPVDGTQGVSKHVGADFVLLLYVLLYFGACEVRFLRFIKIFITIHFNLRLCCLNNFKWNYTSNCYAVSVALLTTFARFVFFVIISYNQTNQMH